MIKILDRYVTSSFLKNYVLSFGILVGLYVVLDMLFNFDDLITVQNRGAAPIIESVWTILARIGDYYFYRSSCFSCSSRGSFRSWRQRLR
jgi:hypothetical protein